MHDRYVILRNRGWVMVGRERLLTCGIGRKSKPRGRAWQGPVLPDNSKNNSIVGIVDN
jgi:hypothetical protein